MKENKHILIECQESVFRIMKDEKKLNLWVHEMFYRNTSPYNEWYCSIIR
jgi:hypothetical protein